MSWKSKLLLSTEEASYEELQEWSFQYIAASYTIPISMLKNMTAYDFEQLVERRLHELETETHQR